MGGKVRLWGHTPTAHCLLLLKDQWGHKLYPLSAKRTAHPPDKVSHDLQWRKDYRAELVSVPADIRRADQLPSGAVMCDRAANDKVQLLSIFGFIPENP